MQNSSYKITTVMDENFKTSLDYSIENKETVVNALRDQLNALNKELSALKLVRDIRDGNLLLTAADGGSIALSFS